MSCARVGRELPLETSGSGTGRQPPRSQRVENCLLVPLVDEGLVEGQERCTDRRSTQSRQSLTRLDCHRILFIVSDLPFGVNLRFASSKAAIRSSRTMTIAPPRIDG